MSAWSFLQRANPFVVWGESVGREPSDGLPDLFELVAQCLLSGVDRDCLAGWGCTVHVLTKEGVTTRHLKGRMD